MDPAGVAAAVDPATDPPEPAGYGDSADDLSLPPGTRYCLGCGYELAGLALNACPECGRDFDPADPKTTGDTPIPLVVRRRFRRITTWLAIILTIASGIIYTVIPIPMQGSGLMLWVWLGRTYGVESRWLATSHVRAWHWAGRVYEVEANDRDTGRVIWAIRAPTDDQWSLRVDKQGVSWPALIQAFNMMKDEMFCVQFTGAARTQSIAGFEASGTKVDVLSAIVAHYGIAVQSKVGDLSQTYVWYFDEQSRRMKTRSITADEALELPSWNSGPMKRLVPRMQALPARPED
jgi:hypothetical protein